MEFCDDKKKSVNKAKYNLLHGLKVIKNLL